MGNWKAGETIGYIPKSMRKRFLDCSIRRGAAWRELETLGEEEMKLFGEIDSEFDLGDWVYGFNTVSSEIILERHKTEKEKKLTEVQRELIENVEGKEVSVNG